MVSRSMVIYSLIARSRGKLSGIGAVEIDMLRGSGPVSTSCAAADVGRGADRCAKATADLAVFALIGSPTASLLVMILGPSSSCMTATTGLAEIRII